ncbi:nuclear transport factor 2 family protein [Candidatus Microthrix parvicella]|uniref:nuclear transport factor 2 family protein n=1 Tax=Candidatus Neomicrothrix parvicella TaxID=41950 RepID=UPI00036B11F9|nr:nuclear transport factor 2 family protein [Candidatus Microthrix parvicella]
MDIPPLDRLLACDEIRNLVARYAIATDARDLDTLVSLFVDDVNVGRLGTGRDALRASFDQALRGIGRSFLFVGTQTIDLSDADHATGQVYCKAEIQDGDRWIHQAILYGDAYERRNGRWYFVRRIHELFYGAEVGVNPLMLPPANWPKSHDGLGTRPEAWNTWREFWSDG